MQHCQKIAMVNHTEDGKLNYSGTKIFSIFFGKDSPLAITSLTTGYLTDSGYIWTPFIIKQFRIENRTAGILLKLQSEPSTSQFFNVLSCCMSLSWSIRRTSLCIVDDRIRKFDTTSQLLMLMLGKTEMRRRLSFTLALFPETESKSESVTQDSVNWRCIPIKIVSRELMSRHRAKLALMLAITLVYCQRCCLSLIYWTNDSLFTTPAD